MKRRSAIHKAFLSALIFFTAFLCADAAAAQKPQPSKGTTTVRTEKPQHAVGQTPASLPDVSDIVAGVNAIIVNIQSGTEDGGTSYGSGFFIDENGLLVTNFHVIREAVKSSGPITVLTTDGSSYTASLKGFDEATDLALLEIKLSDKKQNIALLGDSDAMRVGEGVIAVGSPYGLDHTVTIGIISAKGRSGLDGEYDDYLQTDAAINFGNSGGPLLNKRGEVIGINTLVLAKGYGLGFAIPVNILKEILPDLRERGRVRRSSLVLETSDIPLGLSKSLGLPQGTRGIRVAKVERDTPAARAGLRRDDVITSVNGTSINSTGQFNRLISKMPPGTKIEIKIRRDERDFTVTAEVVEKLEKKDTDKR